MNPLLHAHGMKKSAKWVAGQGPRSRKFLVVALTTAVPSMSVLRRCSGLAEPKDSSNHQNTLENTVTSNDVPTPHVDLLIWNTQ